IRYAKEHNIPVGPGRGSAAGSLVSYSLGITDLDPLQHELLFERFLNPERISMPDIDIDFCMNRRGEVIDYVTRKYGRENVAQIITFGTMAAKAAIEKMGLLKMDFLGLTTLTILDDTLKLIPQTRGEHITLEGILLDDQETYEKVFHSGLTSGVFQFESHGMRDVLRRYRPNSIEDLTALNALYRPGPIQGGMIDDFIDRKHGRKRIEYELPELQEILQET